MKLSFKKDKAFINLLADFEILFSEVVDKLDINIKSLNTFSVSDNTKKYANWNKIETVDMSNYVKYERYDLNVKNQTRIALPWKNYDQTKDISVKIYLEGKLLNLNKDYVIRTEVDSSAVSAGYVIDFGPYLVNRGETYINASITVIRFTTKLPINIEAIDIIIDRYDKTIIGAGQHNYAIPWGSISEKDLHIEVYVNGELWNEDLIATEGTKTYRIFSSYIYFNQSVAGNLTIIRHHKA